MPVSVRYVCPDCRKTMTGGASERWCPDCGAELKRIGYRKKRRQTRAR